MKIDIRCASDAHDFEFELESETLSEVAKFVHIEGVICPTCGTRMKVAVSRLIKVAVGEEESVDLGSVEEVADNPATPIPPEERAP